MNFKEIQELIKLINKSDLSEFKYKKGDVELSIRTKLFSKSISGSGQPIQTVAALAPAPAAPVAAPAAPRAAEVTSGANDAADSNADAGKYLEVKSPIVGTFYRSSGPDKDPFVKVGDTINTGDVVCIVEAMKLFNEIECELSGKIVKVLIEDATPVEYDQVLFLVDPKG